MQPLPEYDEFGHERLSYENSWRTDEPQMIEGADCSAPFANINNGLNRLVLDLTGEQITEMLSALYIGAEFVYPSHYLQIVWNFLKAIHCPIDFEEECQTYPTYTPIIAYTPMNPFMNPDEVPTGYLVPPFVFVSDENIAEYTDFQVGDVIAPINSFPLDTGWFDDLNENLPSFTISVEGEGTININFLNIPQGGLAIVTVDNPPNLIDILAGIITGADNIIDLNLDILSVPPETAQEHIYPVAVTGMGSHTVYVVFFPILDDSLIPLRFGGGLRSIELCDFGEFPMGYVEDVRWDDNATELQQRKNGVYEPVTGFNLLYDVIIQAWNKADNAQSVNASQDALISDLDIAITNMYTWRDTVATPTLEDHETRISALETRADTTDAAITSLLGADTDLQEQIAALDAAIDAIALPVGWQETQDFTADDYGYTPSSGSWVSGQGFVAFANTQAIELVGFTLEGGRIYAIEIVCDVTGSPANVQCGWLGSLLQSMQNTSGTEYKGWIAVPNLTTGYEPKLRVQAPSGVVTIKSATYLGRGENPF